MLADVRSDLTDRYYDKSFRGIDLARLFDAASDKLAAATTSWEAIDVIVSALYEFNDSHTSFTPPYRANRVDYGWRMAAVGEKVLVLSVKPDSDAAARGLAPGDEVVALNRFRPARNNLWQITNYYHVVRPQAQQHLVIRKPDGSERTLDVKSKTEVRQVVQRGDAIDDADEMAWSDRDLSGSVEPGIFVWRMTYFGDEDAAFIDKARGAKAMILDLRGNLGGLQDALVALVGRTFDREIHVATSIGRKGERKVVAKPKAKPFLGSLIVLVDSRSCSAAEGYARVVQIEKRGTVIGDRTGGKVMASMTYPHVFGIGPRTWYGVSVTVSDLRMSDGGALEGVGVTPDEVLLPTPSDLASGRDPVLARAIAMLGGTMTPEQAGKLPLR
jgi:C-terminal processing protease CtpA/Prc